MMFLTSCTTAMVTYCIMKMIPMCVPTFRQGFDTIYDSNNNSKRVVIMACQNQASESAGCYFEPP